MNKAEQSRPTVKNSTDVFLKYWDESTNLNPDEKVEKFKRVVVPASPKYYQFKFSQWRAQGKNPDLQLRRELEEFKLIEKEFRETSLQFSTDLDKNLNSFIQTFPDFNSALTIFVVHSLGEMDGGSREIDGKNEIVFGIDGMVRFHNGATSTPFFHHELFHFYHAQQSDVLNFEQLYQAFWAEGLATYVSDKMNPHSTNKDLMLDIPTGMVQKTKKNLPELLKIVEKKLDKKFESGDDVDYISFFLHSSKNSTIPKRSGYYIGYLIALEMGKNRSLDQLAKLNQKEVLPLMKLAITHLLTQHKGADK